MRRYMRLGPIAIFLTVVVMVITTLAVLTIATSNADRVMATRFASVTQTRYALEARGETFLKNVNDAVSGAPGGAESLAAMEGAEAAGGVYTFTAEDEGYRLEVEATAQGGAVEVTKWKLTRIWNADDPVNDIWPGL